MAPPIELLMTLPFSLSDNEGLLLKKKYDQSMKIKEFGYLSTYERGIYRRL
jgi:hypothetical protein